MLTFQASVDDIEIASIDAEDDGSAIALIRGAHAFLPGTHSITVWLSNLVTSVELLEPRDTRLETEFVQKYTAIVGAANEAARHALKAAMLAAAEAPGAKVLSGR